MFENRVTFVTFQIGKVAYSSGSILKWTGKRSLVTNQIRTISGLTYMTFYVHDSKTPQATKEFTTPKNHLGVVENEQP